MSAARDAFLDAWIALDAASSAVSASKHRPSARTLQREAERHTDALRAFADDIGMNPIHVLSVLQAWRRAGRDHAQALKALEAGLAHSSATTVTRETFHTGPRV